MAHISATDLLFATLTQRGRIIASLRLRGITSFAGIVAYIRRTLSDVTGLIRLTLRCPSRGWSQERNIMLSYDPALATAVSDTAPAEIPVEYADYAPRGGGVQLTLF